MADLIRLKKSRSPQRGLFFTKSELGQLLSLYSSRVISGEWRDYHVSLNWRDDISGLHMACSLDLRVSPDKRGAVREVMGLVNEQLWSGHFDMWLEDGTVLFRDSLLLCGGATATPEQCETLLRLALEACERFFPAFQYVIWAGKEPREAVEACLFETHGTA